MKSIRSFLLILFLLVSGYYFFETLIDTVPSIMVSELMQSFHLSGYELGVLDVSYFVLAALIQIPGGYLLDKYGAHRVLPIAALLCAIGLCIFAVSHDFALALMGRMLAGLGSAFGILGALFVIATKIKPKWLAFSLGCAITIGLAGALLDGPMALIKASIGWQNLTFGLAVIAIIFSILFFCLLPRDLCSQTHENYSCQNLKGLAQSKNLWKIALFGGIMYLPAGTLGSLWGANFIVMAVPHLSLPQASSINSLIFLGWMIGSPLVGLGSDLLKTRKTFLLLGALSCLILLLVLYGANHFSTFEIVLIFLGLGLFSSFSGLTFAMGAESFTNSRAMVIGWINMWAIFPMLIINPLFGHVLDRLSFSLHAYQVALWPLILLIFIACLLAWRLR